MDYFEELKKISADMQEDVKEQIDEQSRSLVIIRKAFSDRQANYYTITRNINCVLGRQCYCDFHF